MATSCHLLGALSHCLHFGRKHGFFRSAPIFSPHHPRISWALSLPDVLWVGGCLPV